MRPLIAAALLALFVAACGGGSKQQQTTPEPTPLPEDKMMAETGTPASDEDAERPLTEAECAEAIEHAIKLLETDPDPQMNEGAAMMRDMQAELVAECQKTGKKKDYDCLMKAQKAADMGLCEDPSARE